MRRTILFYMPTLLLSLITQLVWVSIYSPPISQQALAAAPITPSGLNTQVSQPITLPSGQTQYNISGGTRPGGVTNLFHSFGDFNVPNNNIANFLNNSGLATTNILGRVTGGNISNILGTIQTSGFGNANLFLMNPAGFLFGPNATVNVGGMVSFSSADYLRLADGKLFNTVSNPAADAVLSTAPVAAYGFLGSNPGAITIQGSQLSVTPGQSISLVGGNITIQSATLEGGTPKSAKLSAPGGQINLASVASPGEILVGTMGQGPNINGQSFGSLGAVQIFEQSVVDVSGNGGGTVLIRGGQLLIDNSTIAANIIGPGPVINGAETIGSGIDIQINQNAVIQNGALIDASVLGNATPGVQYGGAHVKADHLEVRGVADFETGHFVITTIQTNVAPGSTGGNSGNITLEGNSILMKDAVQIQSLTNGAGNAGNIKVTANQNIETEVAVIQSNAQSTMGEGGTVVRSTGDAGNIELTSLHGNISLTNQTTVTSQTVDSPGTVGMISVSAPAGNIILADSGFFTYLQPPLNEAGLRVPRVGGSGEVRIAANNLQMNGGNIEVINLGTLLAGDVKVTLAGSLNLGGGSQFPFSTIHASSVGTAPSAGLNIRGHDILLTDGSSISTDTVSTGAAGPLSIAADSLQLINGGRISSSSRQGIDLNTGLPGGPLPEGPAGSVTIQGLSSPAQSVLIDGKDSGVFTSTVGTGAGGNINILANSFTLQNGGTLSAATSGTVAGAGQGGAISVQSNTVSMTAGGHMTASSSGTGAAGQITVEGLASPAQSVIIDGTGSGVFSDTTSTGAGGGISVNANSVTLQNGGSLSAVTSGTLASATGGTIMVKADTVNLNTGGTMTAASTGAGAAGQITVQGLASPAQSVTIDGVGSGIFTDTHSTGAGGNISVNANSVTLQNSGTLSATTSGTTPSSTGGTITVDANQVQVNSGGLITAATTGAGAGGPVNINAGNNFSTDAGTVSSTASQSTGGNINITAGNSISLSNGASLSASSTGQGSAGDIHINAGQNFTATNSSVTTEALHSSGGVIKITTNPNGTVQLTDSTISASVNDGTGGGGSVNIDPQFVILQNSQIKANAVSGPGGNISITTNLLLPDSFSASHITASSQFGQQGTVVIQSPISPASGKIVPLGQKPLLPTSLISQRCAALAGGNISSFTVAGRDALPAEPGGWISSPLVLSMSESEDGTVKEVGSNRTPSETAEDIPLLSLRKIAPPGFLTQSFAVSTDCAS